MNSKVTITFNEDLPINAIVQFDLAIAGQVGTTNLFEAFAASRTQAKRVAVGTPTATIGEISAINYVIAFNLDYNSGGLYNVSRNGNIVTIEGVNPKISFTNFSSTHDVSFNDENFSGTLLEITPSFETATNSCENVRLKIEANQLLTKIHKPISIDPNSNDPIYIDILRSGGKAETEIEVQGESADGQLIRTFLVHPNILSKDNLQLAINNSPNGATVIAYMSNVYGLTLEYSLDGTNFQSSNIFDSLTDGNYTLTVRDTFGCSFTQGFTIEQFGVLEPMFYISKSNSIRFVGRQGVDLRLDENKLSYEDNVQKAYKQIQDFLSSDTEPVEFRTNYSNITIKAKEGDNETTITPSKITNNLRLKDSRDAYKFDLGGMTGIYFTTGKKYDFDSGLETSDYTLNGGLPEWGKKGNYIKINTSWFEIKDIFYDDTRKVEYLIVDTSFTGNDTLVTVGSIYNRENYEVYQFYTAMLGFLDKNFTIEITCTDYNFEDLTYESEEIQISSSLPNHSEILYANDTNTDIMYASGIVFKIRTRIDKISDAPNGESETLDTDKTSILTRADLKETKEIEFDLMTRGEMIKIFRSLFHRKLFIDGTGYVINQIPEVEGGLEESNLYRMKAQVKKTGQYYNAKSFNTEIPSVGGLLEMPSLIEIGEGFIEI